MLLRSAEIQPVFLRFVLLCLCITPLLPLLVLDYMASAVQRPASTTKGSCLLPKVAYKSAQVCPSLPKSAQVYSSLPKSIQVCPSLPKSIQVCPSIPKSTQVYPSLPTSTLVYLAYKAEAYCFCLSPLSASSNKHLPSIASLHYAFTMSSSIY